jgi:hypothetical protein
MGIVRPRLPHRVGVLSLLVITSLAVPASAAEHAAGQSSWAPEQPLSAGFDLAAGYFLPTGLDLGFGVSGPSLGFSFLIQPVILQLPVVRLAARAEASLFTAVLFGGGGEGQAEVAASLRASFGPGRRISPFLSGGIALTTYAATSPLDVTASESGWGFRATGGISLRIGRQQYGHGSTNQFVTPELTWGWVHLETVEYSYLHARLVWTGLSGLGSGPGSRAP